MQGNQSSDDTHYFFLTHIKWSAIQILYEIVEAYKSRSVQVYFVRLREQPLRLFAKLGLLTLIGQGHLFNKVSEAIEAIEMKRQK